MKTRFSCPHCGATLNPNVKVVLLAQRSGKRGLVLLDPKPGVYDPIPAEELGLSDGDRVDFACPACHAALVSTVDENLSVLEFRDEEGRDGRVAFSRICGEHATYVLVDEEVKTYGEHADARGGGNFFGVAPES